MVSNCFVNKLISSQGFTFFSAYIIPEPKSFLDKVFIRNVTGILTLFTDTLKIVIDNHVKPMTAKLLQSLCCGLPFIPLGFELSNGKAYLNTKRDVRDKNL